MILRFDTFEALDGRKLMDLYQESNLENVPYFFPDAADQEAALRKVETNFLHFLKSDFFEQAENTYWILEEKGIYIAGLRLTEFKPHQFYLEALETQPGYRRKGYAVKLFADVFSQLRQDGSFAIYDCVDKTNVSSLKAHEKAGFTIHTQDGFDYLSDTTNSRTYGMMYHE